MTGTPETTTPADHDHECQFPLQPSEGSFWAPGPCCTCGKTYERSQAERQLREAREAMARLGGEPAPDAEAPLPCGCTFGEGCDACEPAFVARPCDCGPDDRCSDCTPPDVLAAAVRIAVRKIIEDGVS